MGEGVQVGVMVNVGVKLGRSVKVTEGKGVKVIVDVDVAVKGIAVGVGTVGKGVGPATQLQPTNSQQRAIESVDLRLERICLYLAGRSTLTLLIQLPNIRKTRAPADAQPKRRGPMLHIIQS